MIMVPASCEKSDLAVRYCSCHNRKMGTNKNDMTTKEKQASSFGLSRVVWPFT